MSVDIGRYRRQITLAGFGLDAQQALADAHVAVLGAGGLGSPALLYLAACGVGTVTVIDDDTVETSNLHRQVIHTDAAVGETKVSSARREMLARNPGMTVYTVTDRLTADNAVDLLRGADVVLDGADNFAARYAASSCNIARLNWTSEDVLRQGILYFARDDGEANLSPSATAVGS